MISRVRISNFRFLVLLTLCVQTVLAADYQTTLLDDAHVLFKSATNQTMYAEAGEQYEFLIHEEGIRNGALFYNAGNSWFMAGHAGQAILNYRRAEQLIPNSKDLQHNLKTALELKSDLIPEKEPNPMARRFLGWHLKTSTVFRWWLFAFCWLLFWGAYFATAISSDRSSKSQAGSPLT